jgi:hypothetical protein
LVSLPGDTSLAEAVIQVNNTATMHTQMPAPRQVFFCFIFVATKKMKLLSGNPDGFASGLKVLQKEQQMIREDTGDSIMAPGYLLRPGSFYLRSDAGHNGRICEPEGRLGRWYDRCCRNRGT